MLRMLKYRRSPISDRVLVFMPIMASIILLYVILSIIVWGGVSSLVEIISSREVIFAVELSIVTSLIASTLALLVSIPIAYSVSRHNFRGKSVVEVVLMLPFAMPPVALGAILLIFFTNTIIGKWLNSLLNIVFEVPGLIVAQFIVIFPMVTAILKSAFDMIDPRYEIVSRTLGYNRLMTLIKVVLPMSKTGIASAFMLGFSRALGEFGASVTLAGAVRFKTETLPIAIYLALSSGDLTLTVALITILLFIAFITLLALHALKGLRIW